MGDNTDPDADGDGVADESDGADSYEYDSETLNSWLLPGVSVFERGFHDNEDQDFVSMLVVPGLKYQVLLTPVDQSSDGPDLVTTLFDDRGDVVAKIDDKGIGETEAREFEVLAAEKYLARVSEFNGLNGRRTNYAFSLTVDAWETTQANVSISHKIRQRLLPLEASSPFVSDISWSDVENGEEIRFWLAEVENLLISSPEGIDCVSGAGLLECRHKPRLLGVI